MDIARSVSFFCLLSVAFSHARAAVYSRVPAPFFPDASSEDGAEVLIPDAKGTAPTGKFKVGRVMDAKIFGQMNEADMKFVRCAAETTLAISGETLRVSFDCPVPPGMNLQKPNSPWWGDRVMFVVRPDAESEAIHYFVAGAGGATEANRFVGKRRDAEWKHSTKIAVKSDAAGFKVDMTIPVRDAFGKVPEPGDVFGVNFKRLGDTAGGPSAWAVNGGAFNTDELVFGSIVFGGGKAYFNRRLAVLDGRLDRLSSDAAARAAVERVVRPVREAIAVRGNDPQAFSSVDRMFGMLERALVAIAQKGDPMLVFEPEDVWGNSIDPDGGAKPLERIAVRLPRNTRTVRAFAVANLGGAPFVGCLKVFDRDWWYFQWQNSDGQAKKNGLLRHARIRRGVRIYSRERRPLYDPLVDLPVGSLVEIPAGDTEPFYLELDSFGLSVGTHKGFLKLQGCAPGFADRSLALEVTVTDDDLDTVDNPRTCYTHFAFTFKNGYEPVTNAIRELVRRGNNTILLSRFDFYPRRDANGNWHAPDFTRTDRYIDAWIAAGLDPQKMRLLPYLGVERDQSDQYWGIRDHNGVRLPFGSPEYDEGLCFMVRTLARHFRERHGVGKDRIYWYPVDEALGKFPDPTLASPAARCAHAARLIKSVDAENLVFSDPMWSFLVSKDFLAEPKAFAKDIDILAPSRPQLTAETVKVLRGCGVRELWSYHVSERENPAVNYRLYSWENMRDGMRPSVQYWHIDECSGFSFRAKHAYAACYVDLDMDILSLSRRQLAADMAHEDGRLVDYLKRKFSADAEKLRRIDTLVRDAANARTMRAMDEARTHLSEML